MGYLILIWTPFTKGSEWWGGPEVDNLLSDMMWMSWLDLEWGVKWYGECFFCSINFDDLSCTMSMMEVTCQGKDCCHCYHEILCCAVAVGWQGVQGREPCREQGIWWARSWMFRQDVSCWRGGVWEKKQDVQGREPGREITRQGGYCWRGVLEEGMGWVGARKYQVSRA